MSDARTLTLALGGRWHRRYGVAPCPVCQPARQARQNALTLADGAGRLLAHCKRSGCEFRDILTAAGVVPGAVVAPDPLAEARRRAEGRAEVEKRARQARTLWDDAQPIAGTVAETYLRRRGIVCPLPPSLRFAPACWHTSARRLPALVALVEGGRHFAVHRTYLRADGSGKADVEPAKAMLGAVAGGAVRLSAGAERLVVAEGIETTLSLGCGLLDGPATLWAALSTSGLRGLRLPSRVGRLVIAPDGDAPGREAAQALAARSHALGWAVSLLTPPEGGDFNDLLTGKAVAG